MYPSTSSPESDAAIKAKIEAIPQAMRNMGWIVSATLMERWLRAPAWRLPEAWKIAGGAPDPRTMAMQHLDQSTVRMNWAMNFHRVKRAVELLRTRVANEAARALIRDHVRNMGFPDGKCIVFGERGLRAIDLEHRYQSNKLEFGETWDTMDDLFGAIGKGTLKVALAGTAERDSHSGRRSIRVSDIGFYIRDTYDFNGFQYLGVWTSNGALSKAQMLANSIFSTAPYGWHGEPIGNVFNGDFEAYRRSTGCGGDFVIYSDVHWESANFRVDLD